MLLHQCCAAACSGLCQEAGKNCKVTASAARASACSRVSFLHPTIRLSTTCIRLTARSGLLLGDGELQRRFAKVALRGFADAVVPAAEIDGVDVHFKDLFLVVLLLNGEGGEHLRRLAGQMLFLSEQGVLGQLLGDGAAALGKAGQWTPGPHPCGG